MLLHAVLAIVAAHFCVPVTAELDCSVSLSCSGIPGTHVDPCCTPSPGGIFIFKQRLQLDVADDLGRWGIDSLQILECDKWRPMTSNASSPSHTHEEIASMCLRSHAFGGEVGYTEAEREWANGEVGEGVEETWERAWETSGRYISTLSPECLRKTGQQETGVPLFFSALHRLYNQFPTAKLLASGDITPSADTTYTLAEIQSAVSVEGHQAVVSCDKNTLSTVAWPLVVDGTFQSGAFKPYTELPPLLTRSNCPADGIRYPSSVHAPPAKPTGTTWDPIYRPQPRAITKSHDEARVYRRPVGAADADVTATVGVGGGARHDPLKLGFFKGKDQGRDENEARAKKKFARDEL